MKGVRKTKSKVVPVADPSVGIAVPVVRGAEMSELLPSVSATGDVPRTPSPIPSTGSSTGTQGSWSWDGTYMYWCVQTDKWVRWLPIRVF